MMSIGDLAEIVAKQFRLMLLVALAAAGVAAYALLSGAPNFESRALLLYTLGREYVYVPSETDAGGRAPDPGNLQNAVFAEMKILANPNVRREAAERLGADRLAPSLSGDPAQLDAAAAVMTSAVAVELIPNSFIVQVSARNPDPALAAEMVNTVIDVYRERRNAVFDARNSAYFERLLSGAQEAAAETRATLRRVLSGDDALVFETERDGLVARLTALRQQAATLEVEQAGLESRVAQLRRELETLAPTVVAYRDTNRNPLVTEAQARIFTLEAQREAAARTVGARHPSVAAIDAEIVALREAIAREPAEVEVGGRTAVNPLYDRVQNTFHEARIALDEVVARLVEVDSAIAAGEARLADVAARSEQVALLQRIAVQQEDAIAVLSQRLREVSALETLDPGDGGNVRVLEKAEPTVEPVGVPKKIRLVLAILFGGAVGAITGFAAYFMRPTILSASMLERRLGAPALGEIEFSRMRSSTPHLPAGAAPSA